MSQHEIYGLTAHQPPLPSYKKLQMVLMIVKFRKNTDLPNLRIILPDVCDIRLQTVFVGPDVD